MIDWDEVLELARFDCPETGMKYISIAEQILVERNYYRAISIKYLQRFNGLEKSFAEKVVDNGAEMNNEKEMIEND